MDGGCGTVDVLLITGVFTLILTGVWKVIVLDGTCADVDTVACNVNHILYHLFLSVDNTQLYGYSHFKFYKHKTTY